MARVEHSRPAQASTDLRGERRRRVLEYRRYLRLSATGALIPGVGLIAAGRRAGWLVLGVVVAGLGAVGAYVARAGRSGLLDAGTDTGTLRLVAVTLMVVAAVWLLVAMTGLRVLEPEGLNGAQRLLAALVVAAVASLVVGPLALAARNSLTQRDLLGSVFAHDDQRSLTVPTPAPDEDPWADLARVNVLLLGSDSFPGRDGTRTDTVMVASIETTSGETTLFALPRNLEDLPFPEGPLRNAYPDGFHAEPDSFLYSVYSTVPAHLPEVFEGIEDPGAEALKLGVGEALGMPIHFYVMVNIRGFEALVQAMGGIDIDVPYDIPIGTERDNSADGCTEAAGWIRKGDDQHLDGYQALWFARARCGPGPVNNDYERMRRQRCVIGAVAERADPIRMATSFQQIAAATEALVSTDIPQRRVGAFVELGLKVRDAGIRSLPFTNEIVQSADPDYDVMREYVAEALQPAPSATSPAPSSPSAGPTGEASLDPSRAGPSESPQPPSESEGAQDLDAVC
jgi:LCP family protein required for cell wall assembly